MKFCRHLSIGTVLLFLLICAANAQDITAINKAITECIIAVRSFHDPMYEAFLKRFDAFYNPSTGQVENNATMAGDQSGLFQFNKCMASKGYPLGSKKQQ
jgi:hypothetical protein